MLNKLDLAWNGLGDDGIVAVADMLKQNPALTHLDVSHNRVNPDGCRELAEGIRNNQNLRSLEVIDLAWQASDVSLQYMWHSSDYASLLCCQVGFNPMGVTTATGGKLQHDETGIRALIDALVRARPNARQSHRGYVTKHILALCVPCFVDAMLLADFGEH